MPELENVMSNFMQCSQLLFGSKVRFAVSFKKDMPGIIIYKRKYFHNFKVTISTKDYEGAIGLNMQLQNKYLMA